MQFRFYGLLIYKKIKQVISKFNLTINILLLLSFKNIKYKNLNEKIASFLY